MNKWELTMLDLDGYDLLLDRPSCVYRTTLRGIVVRTECRQHGPLQRKKCAIPSKGGSARSLRVPLPCLSALA